MKFQIQQSALQGYSLSVDSQGSRCIKNMKLVEVQDNPDPVVYMYHFFPVAPGDKRCAIKADVNVRLISQRFNHIHDTIDLPIFRKW
jgi:hypothetical protein